MIDYLGQNWTILTALGFLLSTLAIVVGIPVVLWTKKDTTSAVSWCLVVFLLPFGLGGLLFWIFGYTHVYRPVKRRRRHRRHYQAQHPPSSEDAQRGDRRGPPLPAASADLAQLALSADAFPVTRGNAVTLFHDTAAAFAAMLDAIRVAEHHLHLEYYIVRDDAMGQELLALLTEKARAGVRVRLLYDSLGGFFLPRRFVRELVRAGGKVSSFLPVNVLRSRLRVNFRNHRKILVADANVAFTGGMNIGDEYLGRCQRFGYWRDTVMRLEGPAVNGLQRVFTEDWDFAAGEALTGPDYFHKRHRVGAAAVQVMESGPDQTVNTIREVYFGAIAAARQRLWIATPYFVPDAGLLDVIRQARYRGVDVRLLMPSRPDHFLTWHAGHYYWDEVLLWGVQIFQYSPGMMHAKVVIVDERCALVGTANLDNRSLHLNFEVGCLLHDPELVKDLETAYLADCKVSVLVVPEKFGQRPLARKLLENGCRLLSPIL